MTHSTVASERPRPLTMDVRRRWEALLRAAAAMRHKLFLMATKIRGGGGMRMSDGSWVVAWAVTAESLRPLSMNARPHWATRSRATTAMRRSARLMTQKLHGRGGVVTPIDVRVDVEFRATYRTAHRRDPSNLAGPLKPILDGIVDAGLLVDDDSRHVRSVIHTVEHDPTIKRGTVGLMVILTPVGQGLEGAPGTAAA